MASVSSVTTLPVVDLSEHSSALRRHLREAAQPGGWTGASSSTSVRSAPRSPVRTRLTTWLQSPNQWDAAMGAVAHRLLGHWAAALGGPPDIFDAVFAETPATLMKIVRYPAGAATSQGVARIRRGGAHAVAGPAGQRGSAGPLVAGGWIWMRSCPFCRCPITWPHVTCVRILRTRSSRCMAATHGRADCGPTPTSPTRTDTPMRRRAGCRNGRVSVRKSFDPNEAR